MIDILLGTYNGARHLDDLLASLADQTHTDWRLIVRDDGSCDNTLAVLRDWQAKPGFNMVLVTDRETSGGACANFAALLDVSDAPYFAFCDQDDVWLPAKLETMLAEARKVEAAFSTDHPVLVHSDLEVVDASLAHLADSYWRLLRFDPSRASDPRSAFLENAVTGCATLGNAALRKRAMPIPDAAIMHDWWLALVATWFGTLVAFPQATIQYRQHGGNVIGASDWSLPAMAARFARQPTDSIRRTRRIVARTQEQAAAFANQYARDLDPVTIEFARRYGGLQTKPLITRKTFMARERFVPSYAMRTLLYWLVI